MTPRFIWTVYGFGGPGVKPGQWATRREDVASFFDYGDAVHFVNHPEKHGATKRNLFINGGRYDCRQRGYRVAA